jgi:Patatin-like phospholipase
MRFASLSAVVAVLLCACAAPTPLRSPSAEGALKTFPAPESSEDLIGIAISGGGSRAATFASYVLEELARIDVSQESQSTSLLEKVQYISSVSGGSLSAAYYSMRKPEKAKPVLEAGALSPDYQSFFRDYHTAMQTSWEEALWEVSLGDATRRDALSSSPKGGMSSCSMIRPSPIWSGANRSATRRV